MRIDSVIIRNFKIISTSEIVHLDPHLNLFIGVNGAGKSTILDAIARMLSAFIARLSTPDNLGAKINSEEIQNGKSECSITLTIDNGVSWTKYKSKKLNKTESSDFRQLREYTNIYRIKLDSNEIVNIPVIVHYGVKRAVSSISLRSQKKAVSSPTLAYKNWYDSKASYQDIFPWIREEEDYENELIRDNPDARDRGLEALRKAMLRIFPEYTDMRVRRKPRLELIIKKNNNEFAFSELSDGEKCYIALVCDIVRRLTLANPTGDILDGNGIVLIDEIDLHLHPTWEQTVMEKLHAAFPNIQFIVTAHSPLVASHFDGNVYAVNNGEVVPLPRLFGLDYSTILQDWMGTRPDNRQISSLVDLYRTYTKNGMSKQASGVKSRLIELLGDKDSLVLKML